MIMSLDDAIKHCEEVADVCEFEARKYDMTDAYESYVGCQEGECAAEHRQLAKMLKDYKRLLEKELCEDAVEMVEELDFIQPKKIVGKMISADVLDEIRAEIMELQTYKMFEGENTIYSERDDVLAIIDKYKTGEGEE